MKLFASVKDGCRIVFNGEFKSLLFYRTPKHTLNFLVEEINAAHEKAVAERDARIAELEKALEPFADPDLSEVLSGNCKGDDSPVFQRDKAMLLIGHFRKARKALGKGE